ncbi:MAG TPA: Pycsar system effector family protein [Allosphingosinicella sp.]|nr:Pycsar system effector family protein [Allosphingosinicella sp.]
MVDESEAAPEPAVSPNAIHLLRTTQLAHLQLSAMADQKASILMGGAFVIFAIAVGQGRGAAAPLPLLILGGTAFFAALCAVTAVLPSFAARRKVPANLLFFGSFTDLSEEEYLEALTSRLGSDAEVHRMMARDIYQNGCVLRHKKYRMLGWAYRIFLAGLVASAAAFMWGALR